MSVLRFVELQKHITHKFEENKLDEVHQLIDKAIAQYPEAIDKTSYWKASVYAKQGKKEQALSTLINVLERGIWWNPQALTNNPDLMSLQSEKDFNEIMEKCKEELCKHNQKSKSKLTVMGNPNADIGLFSIHWRASTIKDYAPYWLDKETEESYFLGFPQSSQVYGYNSYSWDNGKIALKDLTDTMNEYKLLGKTNQCILTGASQGGKLSIELSLQNYFTNTNGFIAVIPAIKETASIEEMIKTNLKTIKEKSLKGCIITGNKDPFYQKTIELKPMFESYQIPCKWFVIEGLAHYFPNHFLDLVHEGIHFVKQS